MCEGDVYNLQLYRLNTADTGEVRTGRRTMLPDFLFVPDGHLCFEGGKLGRFAGELVGGGQAGIYATEKLHGRGDGGSGQDKERGRAISHEGNLYRIVPRAGGRGIHHVYHLLRLSTEEEAEDVPAGERSSVSGAQAHGLSGAEIGRLEGHIEDDKYYITSNSITYTHTCYDSF